MKDISTKFCMVVESIDLKRRSVSHRLAVFFRSLSQIAALALFASGCSVATRQVSGSADEAKVLRQLGWDVSPEASWLMEQRQIRVCMLNQGYGYTERPLPLKNHFTAMNPISPRDLNGIRENGYNVKGLVDELHDKNVFFDPNSNLIASLSQHDQNGYFSTREQCRTKANKQSLAINSASTKLEKEAARINADPVVVEAYRKWTECMKQEGFAKLQTPQDAFNLVLVRFRGLGPKPAGQAVQELYKFESQISRADVKCFELQQENFEKARLQLIEAMLK